MARKTVLIVEDNELNMKLFNDLLRAHGYHTLCTRDGRDALQIARAERPDLILMDIQLPEISGLEVTWQIKQDAAISAIPVIAVTAFAMKGDEARIRRGGCEAYISKPIAIADFVATVKHHIGDGPAQPEPGSDAGSGLEPEPGSDAGSGLEPEPGSDAGSDLEPEPGSDAGSDLENEPGNDAGSGPGPDSARAAQGRDGADR